MPVGQPGASGGSSGLAMKARASLKGTRAPKKEEDSGLVPTGSTIADKIAAFNTLREKQNARSAVPRKQLENQNNALDKQTSDFAARHAGLQRGRGRSRSTLKPPADEAKGMKRGISADPHLSNSDLRGSKRESKVKSKATEEPKSEPPEPPPPPPPKPEMKDMGCGDDTPMQFRAKKSSTETFKNVVQTKVASLSAFKKAAKSAKASEEKADSNSDPSKLGDLVTQGIQTDPEVAETSSQGILKKSTEGLGDQMPESKLRVTFSSLPNKWRQSQGSLCYSEPDLRSLDPASSSAGSSFDSTRSMSDESVATICSTSREDAFISGGVQMDLPLVPDNRCDKQIPSTNIPDYIENLQTLYSAHTRDPTALALALASCGTGQERAPGSSLGTLLQERDRLVQFIAMAVIDLHKVNLQLETAYQEVQSQLDVLKSGVQGGSNVDSRGPKPLTLDHKRLLRFKSYSFPFLTEDSWTKTLVSLEGSEDSCAGAPLSNQSKQESSESSESDFDFDEADAFIWTNFLTAQETVIGNETPL